MVSFEDDSERVWRVGTRRTMTDIEWVGTRRMEAVPGYPAAMRCVRNVSDNYRQLTA